MCLTGIFHIIAQIWLWPHSFRNGSGLLGLERLWLKEFFFLRLTHCSPLTVCTATATPYNLPLYGNSSPSHFLSHLLWSCWYFDWLLASGVTVTMQRVFGRGLTKVTWLFSPFFFYCLTFRLIHCLHLYLAVMVWLCVLSFCLVLLFSPKEMLLFGYNFKYKCILACSVQFNLNACYEDLFGNAPIVKIKITLKLFECHTLD